MLRVCVKQVPPRQQFVNALRWNRPLSPIHAGVTEQSRERDGERGKSMEMGDAPTFLSLEPKRMATKLNRKALTALRKLGHHNMPRMDQGVVHSARLCVICQHSPSGTCRIQILTIVQTLQQRIAHHPLVLVACGAVTNSKGTTIKLHPARCCELASFVQCKPSRYRCCPTNSKPMIFVCCAIFDPSSGFVIKSAGSTFVPTFFVTSRFEFGGFQVLHVNVFCLAPPPAVDHAHPDVGSNHIPMPKSFATLWIPNPSDAFLTAAYSSLSAMDTDTTCCFLVHTFKQCPPLMITPTGDFVASPICVRVRCKFTSLLLVE